MRQIALNIVSLNRQIAFSIFSKVNFLPEFSKVNFLPEFSKVNFLPEFCIFIKVTRRIAFEANGLTGVAWKSVLGAAAS